MKNGALFLEQLKKYNAEGMNEVNKKCAMDLIDAKKEDFDTKEMRKKSSAAAGLCDWLKNIIEYNTVYRFVEPLRV